MKFTSFNPLIVSADAEAVIKLFEDLGFERDHQQDNVGGINVDNTSLKDPNGFKVDVAYAPDMKQDLTIIRMNVDDFDAAYDELIARGFTHQSGRIVRTDTSVSAMLKSPSGFAFDLCHHIKK